LGVTDRYSGETVPSSTERALQIATLPESESDPDM